MSSSARKIAPGWPAGQLKRAGHFILFAVAQATGIIRAKHPVTSNFPQPFKTIRLRQFLITAAVIALCAGTAPAQEALRQSLAGEAAAEASRQAATSIGYYNLKLGPVACRFSSSLDTEYNDNVNLRPNNPDGDLIFRPGVDAEMTCPVSDVNSLNLGLGLGYSYYLQHSELDQLYISPGSGLSFDIYVKDLKVNLHDRLSVTENAYENPGLVNSSSFVRLENTAGASGLLDLNEAVVNLGYDHANFISLSGNQEPDSASDNLFANAGFRLRPELLAGLEFGGGLFQGNPAAASPLPNATQWNTGLFFQAQISEYLSAEFHAGFTEYSPQSTATLTNLIATTGLYFQFSVTHQLNRFLGYTLSAGRSTDYSNYGVPDEYYFVRWEPDWNLFQKISLSTPIQWEKGTQLATVNSSTSFNQISATINVSRSLTQKLTGNLSEQFVRETSNQPNGNYTVNIVSLNFSYRF